jgi:GNAT superfamily N-acetyltransferase
MQITDFTAAHIEQAARIAKQNYEAERGHVPALPPIDNIPDLRPFAENGLGGAAVDGGDLLGFLCCWNPWDNAWSNPGLRHIFSPMGANGTVEENRAAIYARLYQAAGEKWARAGAASHGVCLYAHDAVGQAQFFRYGFGMRCVDAIRPMEDIDAPRCEEYILSELAPENAAEVMPLDNMLHEYQLHSPFFMFRPPHNEAGYMQYFEERRPVCFTARYRGETAAYILIEKEGETFLSDSPGYCHISAAYCLPEHRGRGLLQNLINSAMQKMKAQGCTRLGVDFESFNPSGAVFWLKHFAAYTHSAVRRIDESVVKI